MSEESCVSKQLACLPDVQDIQECFLGEEHSCLKTIPDGIDIGHVRLVYFCSLLEKPPFSSVRKLKDGTDGVSYSQYAYHDSWYRKGNRVNYQNS